jgi:DnaJ-class molecular chaperone
VTVAADPYETLGVGKDATQDDIRSAYRKRAKKLHPDLNPGDKQAEEQFKELSAAYDLLGDADKRARFDRGEIDASGAERPPRGQYYRDFHGADADRHAYSSDAGYADFADTDDILSELFGRTGGRTGERGGMRFRARGQDVQYRLPVEFLDAVNGATRRINLPDGSVLDVTIPPGTRDGQVLRLRGKGMPGIGDGPPGDALVEIEVGPHRFFRRNGDDIELDLPVSLPEAVLGAKLDVPTPSGPVRMTIPKGASSGTRLRLKGKGVPRRDGSRGDQYVVLRIMLPERPDAELEDFMRRWSAAGDQHPRQHMEA